MNKNYEKEYKILVNKQQFQQLYSLYPTPVFTKQINTYYDTADRSIRSCLGAMRIREKSGAFIFTLKMQSEEGLLEYECPVDENNTLVFHTKEITTLLASYGIVGPFKALTTLTTYRAVYDYGFAEICFDKNIYNGIKDYEIEYEYKKDHNGRTFFQEILDHIGLIYEKNCTSKIERVLQTL